MADSNICRNLFYECQEQLKCGFKKSEEESENFLNDLRKRTETFLKLIQKKAKTLDSDVEALNILIGGAENESDQENVPIKKGRGRKKKPLAESIEDNLEAVKIKQEKISVSNQASEAARGSITSTTSSVSEIPVEEIKSEILGMPAPTWIPPKKKPKEIKIERGSVRSTRTKGKKGSVRDSDVVVQNTTITTINLSDSEESDRPVRRTRTKTRKGTAQSQTDSGTETDTESTRSTKTRNKKEEQNIKENLIEETRRTVKKGKKAEEDESQEDEQEEIPPTRSTRTKTNRKAAKEPEESANINNNNKEEAITETTRSTRTKTKKATEKEEQINGSEKSSDTSKESKANDMAKANKVEEATVESKNQGGAKRNRSDSPEGEISNKKRSKSTSPVQEIEGNATAQTVYEDAHSSLGPSREKSKQQLNCTYVADLPIPAEFIQNSQVPRLDATVTIDPLASYAADSTIVKDKPHLNNLNKKSDNDLLTDDDDEVRKTPPKKAAPVKAGKEVFSPYEKTTLKKKVEAFEKLQNGNDIPVKLSANLRNIKGTPLSVHEKAKMFTPLGSTFMPSGSSTSKISRLINNRHDSSSNESLSAIKLHGSAQKEARDRQRRLMERELAQKKKEAMLKKQAEDKKKLNEEKQLKAQQQRKALEAEKLKQLQLQKQKEERQKQRELEREEYLQKQKLEAEKKRLAQKKKIQEIQEQRQKILDEQAKNPPVYMVTKLPKLPTNDCYDSDDPDYEKVTPPLWCIGEHLRTKQLTMLAAGEKIKNTFFCRKPQTANLVDIFEVIDPRKLKRSSSRYWKAPPRYTMMPDLNETRFSEDDELYDSD